MFDTRSLACGLVLALASIGTMSAAMADTAIYFGGGAAQKGDATQSDAMPLSFGIIAQNAGPTIWGLDFGIEGTMLDSTWGQDQSVSAAASFNLIYGVNLSRSEGSRVDLGGLLGLREATADCPDSFLGFRCYADQPPEMTYAVNYGVILTYTTRKALFGLRATGESVQALIGVKF